ncbi:MAG: hypothetical protein M3R06_01795 [Chloroflexota bacterium]|nr:hypothetical protein [Chloroflexota bacterium]
MGQALVILIMVLALTAVVMAVATDPRLGDEAPSFRDPPPPEPARSTLNILSSFQSGENLVLDRVEEAWMHLAVQGLTAVPTLIDMSRHNLTLDEANEATDSEAFAAPAAVLLWTILAEFNGGSTLASYEDNLDNLLTTLDNADCRTVVAGAPSALTMATLNLLPIDFDVSALPYWNAATARIAAAHDARYVDLTELPADSFCFAEEGDIPLLVSPAGHRHLAELLSPAIEWALSSAPDYPGETEQCP